MRDQTEYILIMLVILGKSCNAEKVIPAMKKEKLKPMKKFDYSLPLIDEGLVDELYGGSVDEESGEMQREIWSGMRESFLNDLEKAIAGNPEDFRGALHRIRGYCSSSGAQRIGELLLDWEQESDPAIHSPSYFQESRSLAIQTFEEIEKRHPHLISKHAIGDTPKRGTW